MGKGKEKERSYVRNAWMVSGIESNSARSRVGAVIVRRTKVSCGWKGENSLGGTVVVLVDVVCSGP